MSRKYKLKVIAGVENKSCTECGLFKPFSEFKPYPKNTKLGIHSWCYDCHNKFSRVYYSEKIGKEKQRLRAVSSSKRVTRFSRWGGCVSRTPGRSSSSRPASRRSASQGFGRAPRRFPLRAVGRRYDARPCRAVESSSRSRRTTMPPRCSGSPGARVAACRARRLRH